MSSLSPELVFSDEASALLDTALHSLAPRLTAATRDALLNHTRGLERTPSSLRLAVDAAQLDAWLGAGHLAALEGALSGGSYGSVSLALVPVDDVRALACDPTYTFARFVASPANAEARSRALTLAEPGERAGSALVFTGPTNSGKTHLLRAIGAALTSSGAPDGVLYRSAEQLSLELIHAIWSDELTAYRARLAGARALLVDDADALAGRDATQEELALALNALLARGGRVAISFSKPPEKIAGIVDALRTALVRCERLEVRPPEWETRVAIVLDHARRWRIEPSTAVAAHLASRLRTNLSSLDAVLTRLMTRSVGAAALQDLELLKHSLRESTDRRGEVSPEDVLNAVARQFNVRLRELRSQSRSSRIATPRQIAMYLMRRHCGFSYPEIGRRFGRHHTTALHSDRVIQAQVADNASLRAAILLVEKELAHLSDAGE
jgi:chromosomal replication initiator protein